MEASQSISEVRRYRIVLDGRDTPVAIGPDGQPVPIDQIESGSVVILADDVPLELVKDKFNPELNLKETSVYGRPPMLGMMAAMLGVHAGPMVSSYFGFRPGTKNSYSWQKHDRPIRKCPRCKCQHDGNQEFCSVECCQQYRLQARETRRAEQKQRKQKRKQKRR